MLSSGSWPSVEMEIQDGDSLTLVRKRYLNQHPDGLLCTGLIERSNRRTPGGPAHALFASTAPLVSHVRPRSTRIAWTPARSESIQKRTAPLRAENPP